MERTEVLDLMGELKLFGMRGAFDEVMANGLKRRHEPQQIIGELLKAEVAEKEARSIKYQLTIAKLPLAKDLTDFDFKGTPINEALVRDLATGGLPRPAAQCRPGRRNRLRKDPSGNRNRALLHSAAAHAAVSLTSSIWSTVSRPRRAMADRVEWPITSPARTSPFSTNSAICRLHNQAASCSSI